MSAKESEILKEAIIKAHDLTLDEATRANYQAIEKHIMEKNTVLRERDMIRKETEEIQRELQPSNPRRRICTGDHDVKRLYPLVRC